MDWINGRIEQPRIRNELLSMPASGFACRSIVDRSKQLQNAVIADLRKSVQADDNAGVARERRKPDAASDIFAWNGAQLMIHHRECSRR